MRKNIFVFVSIVLLFTILAACGTSNNNGNNANGNNESNNNALSEDKKAL